MGDPEERVGAGVEDAAEEDGDGQAEEDPAGEECQADGTGRREDAGPMGGMVFDIAGVNG